MLMETRSSSGATGKLVAVMNAKGGSGATLLACNLAHQLSAKGGRTLLLDLDLQFGSVAHYLDVQPSHSHVEVLQQIARLTGITLEQADRVYIVVQQSLSHLKDASRLARILRDELGVRGENLQVVVNRYNKSDPITLRDIATALRCSELQKLPNDFALVSQSQNTGVPLDLHAPRAPITLALQELSRELLGKQAGVEQGVFKRTFNRFFGGVSHAQ